MSDILIKGMEMPERCVDCRFCDEIDATCIALNDNSTACITGKPKWCPLHEVPSPHGDLIDRDRASERFAELSENIEAKLGYECSASYTLASLFLQNKGEFPTIIEGG